MAHVKLSSFLVGVVVAAGCSGSEKETGTNDDEIMETPEPCKALPLRHEALSMLESELEDEAGSERVDPRYPHQGAPYYVYSLFSPADDARKTESILVNGPEDFGLVASFGSDFEEFEVDWATESVVVLLAWPDQYAYRYARSGDTLVVHVGQLEPCSDFPAQELRVSLEPSTMVIAVPKVAQVEAREQLVRYRFSDVPAGRCSGAERVLTRVGGAPSVVESGDTLRLWYAGYSANTGNVLTTSSSDDGKTWSPEGWSMDHLSIFEEHSPYADHYGPALFARESGFWMFYDDTNFQFSERQVFARASSSDGTQWSDEVELFAKGEPGSWSSRDIGSPYVVEHEGKFMMWYVGLPDDRSFGSAIGLALSDDGTTWTQHPDNPVLRPGKPGSFDDLGVSSPAVRFDGERFVMLYAATTGGGDVWRPQFASIGVATSTDGVTWERAPEPLATERPGWAHVGFQSVDFVLHDDSLTAFVSGINESAEPSIGRLSCDLP
jgi:predicted GH43/DUF377 family glycosyl hydrolase